ncbi:MAG: hypothetical protein GY822_19430 [Deltaproteobacteria bacterium]|nr:hypothetical protein [Deltaproteobacteria bacterium]
MWREFAFHLKHKTCHRTFYDTEKLPLAFVVGLLLVAVVAVANHGGASGRYVPYQGHFESDGSPVTTLPGAGKSITFTFYDAETAGTELDVCTHVVDVDAGKFAVNIGPVPDAAFASANLYVAVAVEGNLLAGRQKIHGSTFAIRGEVGKPFAVDELNALGNENAGGDVDVIFDVTAGRDVIATDDLVGTRAVVDQVQFPNTIGKKLNLWDSNYGFGIANSPLQAYTSSAAAVKFGSMTGDTFTEGTSFYPDGRILCPRLNVTNFSQTYASGNSQIAGGSVTTNGGKLLIQFSVTGYRSSVGNIQFQLVIDGVGYQTYTRWANESNSHKIISDSYFIAESAGMRTIQFRANSATSNVKDRARGTVLELPF